MAGPRLNVRCSLAFGIFTAIYEVGKIIITVLQMRKQSGRVTWEGHTTTRVRMFTPGLLCLTRRRLRKVKLLFLRLREDICDSGPQALLPPLCMRNLPEVTVLGQSGSCLHTRSATSCRVTPQSSALCIVTIFAGRESHRVERTAQTSLLSLWIQPDLKAATSELLTLV